MESIFLDLNDGQQTKRENTEPYALFGNSGRDFRGGSIPIGNNSISFDLYSEDNLRGELLETVTRDFTIIDDRATAADLDIGLYDADSDTLITILEEGDELLASTIAGQDVTIAAFIPEKSDFFGKVESMFLDLNEGQITKRENIEPYALFGDNAGDFRGGSLPVGDNNLSFDLYSKDRLQGDFLGSITRSFTIINDLPA